MAKQEFEGVMKALGLTIIATFVPYSISRNAPKPQSKDEGKRKGWLSLNWQVELRRDGNHVLVTPYAAGSGHAPAAKSMIVRARGERARMIAWECEKGVAASQEPAFRGKRIEPDAADVVSSLVLDADVLSYPSFEEWAISFGYDSDSRAAEQTYRTCLELALALRSSVGDEGMRRLRAACEDY